MAKSYLEDMFLAILSCGRSQTGIDLPEPVREYRFHPERRWRFDFAWPANHVAVEVDGGTWGRGRHSRGRGFAADCEKLNQAALLGWTVLRFTADNMMDGQACFGTVVEAMDLFSTGGES
jgi:very-short-patch-repair endonuclease